MAKNLVRKTYASDATFTAPAGVKEISIYVPRVNIASLAAGDRGGMGMTADGQAYSWGQGGIGRSGHGNATDISSPVVVSGGISWLQLSGNSFVSGGISSAGDCYMWGIGSSGQMGDNGTASHSVPTQIAGTLKFRQIAAGASAILGLTTDGDIYAWGPNGAGQLGINTTSTLESSPILVVGGNKYVYVATGSGISMAIDTAGNLWSWGDNSAGALGDGTIANRSSPVQVSGGRKFSKVAVGGGFAIGVTTAGAGYGWGDNSNGTVGDGSVTNRSSPVLVQGSYTFAKVAAGRGHVISVDTLGVARGWGSNVVGQIGDNTITSRSSPVVVSGSHTFFDVAAGVGGSTASSVSYGLDGSGQIWAWGTGSLGGIGNNLTTDFSTPTLVAGPYLYNGMSQVQVAAQRISVVPGTAYPVKIFAKILQLGLTPVYAPNVGATNLVIEYYA